jgi:AcrR family transcriptional regulator
MSHPNMSHPTEFAQDHDLSHSLGGRDVHGRLSSSTLRRVRNASITCLDTLGYAATTTQRVIELAQVSRGAALHYYPNKIELMAGVAEFAVGEHIAAVEDRVSALSPGLERLFAAIDATWGALNTPHSRALFEIMLAWRSDPGLAERVRGCVEKIDVRTASEFCLNAKRKSLLERDTVCAIAATSLASLRALAFAVPMDSSADGAVQQMWIESHKAFLARQIFGKDEQRE